MFPSRVCSAVLRTWWNGWVTVRRVGRHRGLKSRCVGGCSCDDGGAIEQYSVCPVIARWRETTLDLTRIHHSVTLRRTDVMLHGSPIDGSPSRLTKAALALAAVYQVHNLGLHSHLSAVDASQALNQSLREAARGHPFAERVLCTPFAKPVC